MDRRIRLVPQLAVDHAEVVLHRWGFRSGLDGFFQQIARSRPHIATYGRWVIEPIAERTLLRHLGQEAAMAAFAVSRTQRVDTGFYMSQAMELVRS